MTRPSGAASRAAAAHIADDVLAQRAARFHEREQQLRDLLTDYHYATAQAQKIHQDAQSRAAKVTADAQARIAALHEHADKQASEFQDAAHTAVRALLQLGEPRATVASLTTAQVRAIEHSAPPARSTTIRSRPRHTDQPVRPASGNVAVNGHDTTARHPA
jgi:DNA-binding ferritin-like protein